MDKKLKDNKSINIKNVSYHNSQRKVELWRVD